MKKAICTAIILGVVALGYKVFAASVAGNGNISDELINFSHNNVMSGGATFPSGATLTLSTGSTLVQSNINLSEQSLTATYGVNGATLTISGAASVGSLSSTGAIGGSSASITYGVASATAAISGAASVGSLSVTAGSSSLYARTIAQLLAITPTAVGQMYRCSDCSVAGSIAVSTGTSAGQFGIIAPSTFQ